MLCNITQVTIQRYWWMRDVLWSTDSWLCCLSHHLMGFKTEKNRKSSCCFTIHIVKCLVLHIKKHSNICTGKWSVWHITTSKFIGNVRPGTQPNLWRLWSTSNICRHFGDEVPWKMPPGDTANVSPCAHHCQKTATWCQARYYSHVPGLYFQSVLWVITGNSILQPWT
jgi:hypothetical protein